MRWRDQDQIETSDSRVDRHSLQADTQDVQCAGLSLLYCTCRPKMRMPSRRRSSFSRTMAATAWRVGAKKANTSKRLKTTAAASAAGSNVYGGQGKGFKRTATGAGRTPHSSLRPRSALRYPRLAKVGKH